MTVGSAGTPRPAVLASCTAGNAAQQWTLLSDGSLASTNRCLDVPGTAHPTPVDVVTCTGAAGQVWQARPNGTLRNTGTGLCLATLGGSTADGVALVATVCRATRPTQLWQLPG